jgi:hypothetical protein
MSNSRWWAFAAAATVVTWTVAHADLGLPSFRPGKWSFTSTVSPAGATQPQVRKATACTDPTQEIEKKWRELAQKSCQFSPVSHAGDRYSYSSQCAANGVLLTTRSSIVVKSDSEYRVETESRSNGTTRQETVEARRLGDCAPGTQL